MRRPLTSLHSIFWLWLREVTGVYTQNRLDSAAIKTGAILLIAFLVLNIMLSVRLQGFSLSNPAWHDGLKLNNAVWALFGGGSLLVFYITLSRALRLLYSFPLFDRYGFAEKMRLAALLAGTVVGVSSIIGLAHVYFVLKACGITLPFGAILLTIAAGISTAFIIFFFGILISIRSDASWRQGTSILDQCDFVLMGKKARSGKRHIRKPVASNVREKVAYPLLSAFWIMFIVQIKAMSAFPMNVLATLIGIIICSIVMAAMIVKAEPGGTVIAASIAAISFFECFAAPQLIFDRRCAFSGKPFVELFSLFVAPFVIIAALAALLAFMIVGEMSAAIGIWAATAAYIVLRYLMRITFLDRRITAIRIYIAVMIGVTLGFQVAGPIGLLWLITLPFCLYSRAKRRVQSLW